MNLVALVFCWTTWICLIHGSTVKILREIFFFIFWCMQSTHMASQQITEEAVHLCTGNPLPKDIEQISHWLFNESFAVSHRSILLEYKIPLCFVVKFLFFKKKFPVFWPLTWSRNFWDEDKKRPGPCGYYKRSNHVSIWVHKGA